MVGPLETAHAGKGVLFIRVDLLDKTRKHQSRLLVDALGLGAVYVDFHDLVLISPTGDYVKDFKATDGKRAVERELETLRKAETPEDEGKR